MRANALAADEHGWPREHLIAAGRAYRDARGEGVGQLASLARAEEAYLAAGGDPHDAGATVLAMIRFLAWAHGDWLFGPAQDWTDRHRAAES
jgi:hypothetical protein